MRALVRVLFAITAVATVPPLSQMPGSGLDPSWKLALHLAVEQGITVGDDVFFTYGPWGWLSVPLALDASQWAVAAAYQLAVHAALFAALALWMLRCLPSHALRVAALVPLLLFAPNVEYRLLLALVLAARLLSRRGASWPAAAALGAVAGASMLVKFSTGLAALAVVAGAVAAAGFAGRRRVAAALGCGFLAGAAIGGTLALGTPGKLIAFLSTSWQIGTGYVLAQERGGPLWQSLLALSALALAALGHALGRGKLAERMALGLPAAGLMAVVLKHGFVRQETHAPIVFQVAAVLLCWLAVESFARRGGPSRWCTAVAATAMIGGAWVAAPPPLVRQPWVGPARLAGAWETARQIGDPDWRAGVRQELQREQPLGPNVRGLLEGRGVDVLTTELSLIEAWQLEWAPRRILQSYAVGTARLDAMDAQLFAGDRAPERLLVDLLGLDTRHPFMDAPRTWREILRRYEALGRDGEWLVLGRREQPHDVVETEIGRARIGPNEPFEVPHPGGGHLEVRVDLRPSLPGKMAALTWKVPEVRLALVGRDVVPARRIVAATADRPFPLTFPWADSADDLLAVFSRGDLPAPRGMAFLTRGEWAWSDAEVVFYRVDWD